MSSNTNYKQWIRKYRVVVSGSGKGWDVSELRCVFQVEKSMNETPNFSKIVIYNLKDETVAKIKVGDTIILEAGYQNGNYGMIFTGEVVQVYNDRESGVDSRLNLICQDGDKFLNSSFTMTTLKKGSTVNDAMNRCAEISKNVISDKVTGGKSYIRGKVMFGQSSKYLKEIAKTTETQFFVEDNKINIVGAKDYASNTAVLLNADTGLIGDPSQTDDGVSGQCLINPSIKLNTLIKIDSSSITAKAIAKAEDKPAAFSANGVYRVTKLTYEGDTHGDPWYCKFDAITQDGSSPTGTATQQPQSPTGTGEQSQGSDPPQSVLYQLANGNAWR